VLITLAPEKLCEVPPELEVLIEEFRDEAIKLVDLLDASNPVVRKIKVFENTFWRPISLASTYIFFKQYLQ
jgi:predicted DNA-binding protein (UPF0251 family)